MTDLTLSDIQDAEYTAEQSRDLQNLADTFYEDARTYTQSLDAERRRETAESALRTLAEERHAKLRERVMLGVSVDTRTLTHEEQEVYAKLQNGGVDAETAVSLVVESETEGNTDSDGDVDRLEIRVLEEQPEILALDGHTYPLGEEDVVNLPRRNAEILVEGGVAEPVRAQDEETDDEQETESEGGLLAEAMGGAD